MKLNEDIKRIKNIIEGSDKLNESETIGNRTWFDDTEFNTFEKVMNRMLSKKYPWWKKMDISHMVYDTKEKKLTFSGDLTLKQEWVDSLDYDLELEDGEVTWLGDFLSPEDGYKIREDFAESFSFVFGLPTDSVRYNVEVLIDEPQDITEEIENELPKKSKIDLVRELVKKSGFKTASDVLGGTANLINILFDGDMMKYYEETGFKPIRITDDGTNMYIDDLIISSFGLEPKGSGVFGKEIYLGDFSWKSGGFNYKFTANIRPFVSQINGQKLWRVVGTSGDSGFGYGFINKRNTIGKRGRTQIFKQIIDKYNLSEFL